MSDVDFARLTGRLVAFSQQMLAKHGEFYPFAAVVGRDGSVEMIGADIGSERPASTDLIEFLRGSLKSMATEKALRACGICLNAGARLPGYPNKVDAICCQLEANDRTTSQVFIPYRKGFFGKFKFDGPVSSRLRGFERTGTSDVLSVSRGHVFRRRSPY